MESPDRPAPAQHYSKPASRARWNSLDRYREGLANWKDGRLHEYGEFTHQNVLTLLEDREGRLWVGTFQVPQTKLCTIEHGQIDCYGNDGSLGQWVWSLYENSEGRVWAGAETGLWRWKPGP